MNAAATAPWTPFGTIEHDIQAVPLSVESLVQPIESMYDITITGLIVSRSGTNTFQGCLWTYPVTPGNNVWTQMRVFRTTNREAVRRLWINTTGIVHFTWLIGAQTGEVWWTY